MKKITLLLLITLIFSCNKKVVELPEISHSDITEIQDVSAAYLFYDETQPDSVELNRKNLISTTNWLVNVDKRLTLKQAIPHIKFLQEKKANGAHKNENAKNYYTCHDTSRNNLGFVEFTNVIYHESHKTYDSLNKNRPKVNFWIKYHHKDSISLFQSSRKCVVVRGICNLNNFAKKLKEAFPKKTLPKDFEKKLPELKKDYEKLKLNLSINPESSFQEYISLKIQLTNIKDDYLEVSNHEFIY